MRSWLVAAAALTLCASVAQAQVEEPALSPPCQAPNADIAMPAPLPRLADRLEKRLPVRILAIGSSSTWGIGASSDKRTYPAQLEVIFKSALKDAQAEIINSGVGGELAQTTAERMRIEAAVDAPDVVLWQVGTNDALARVPLEEFEKTVRTTIDWLRANNIDPVLVGLQYTPKFARDESYVAVKDALRRIASSMNVLHVRRYDAMQFMSRANGAAEMMSGDDLHLNDLGYRCMAEHVAHAVIASVFLRQKKPATQSAGR